MLSNNVCSYVHKEAAKMVQCGATWDCTVQRPVSRTVMSTSCCVHAATRYRIPFPKIIPAGGSLTCLSGKEKKRYRNVMFAMIRPFRP